jgi:NAD(P)-dependent dehydrogenase (short-subunit alcohol dehydrogenase family)/acyl carrier protein
MHEGGYILGTSYRWVHEVARDGDELLGELRPPENQEGLEDYPLHPGFVDSCFQVLGGWSLDPTVWADGDLIVPFSIARLTVHRRPRGTVWCHARIEGGKDVRAEESLGGDLRLFDAQGLVAEIQGFRGRLASRDSVLRGMQPRQLASRYERSWRPGPAAPPVRPVVDARPWVLLEDAQGVGERLGRMLEAAGASVRRVRPGSGFRNLGGGAFEVDARDFAQGWAEAAGPAGCAGVVYLWGLDGAPAQGASAEAVQRAALEASGGALNLVKALVGQGGAPAPLWLVTRGAWAIEPSASPLALSQSVLWGLGRVLDLEHPGLRCTRVDLDPGELERSVQLLGAELSRGEDSPVREVAFRAGTCLYPVLREAVGPRGDAVAIRSDATYLITGGLGGLGLETARWLVERGARALVLVGRRAPSASASEAVRALEGAGVRVSVASVDVSREEAVSALLRRMDAELPPLRGIIHAAGVLDDGALLKQDLERFERVMAPKVAGAWNLHRLTEGRPLDFFVLFSSASATLGSPGQGNYAAANAFLDALAEERRARGLVAQSLAWGPWAETGMVGAADGPLARELERRGVRPLPTREALALLGDALTRDRAGGMLLSIQWPLYLRGVGALARSPLYEGVAPAAPREAVAPVRSRALLAEQLLAAVPHERPEVLARSLQEEVARVLQLPPAELGRQQEFADVGMDSLMAIELRDALQKELGRSIPVTAALEHRTVEALARYLLEEVVKDTPPEAPRAAPRLEPEAALEEELSMLSDAELARLVAEDLAKES